MKHKNKVYALLQKKIAFSNQLNCCIFKHQIIRVDSLAL